MVIITLYQSLTNIKFHKFFEQNVKKLNFKIKNEQSENIIYHPSVPDDPKKKRKMLWKKNFILKEKNKLRTFYSIIIDGKIY